MRVPIGPLFTTLLIFTGLIPACSGPGFRMHQVPEHGYDQTLNYQFQAQVHADLEGRCKQIIVRVRPLNKVYWRKPPPDRLQLFDDNCFSPVRFERVHYISKRTGQSVRLSGREVIQFMSEYSHLENELIGWLWRKGII